MPRFGKSWLRIGKVDTDKRARITPYAKPLLRTNKRTVRGDMEPEPGNERIKEAFLTARSGKTPSNKPFGPATRQPLLSRPMPENYEGIERGRTSRRLL